MDGWLHGVFVGELLFVFPLCGFSLSLFCNHYRSRRIHASCSGARCPLDTAQREQSCVRGHDTVQPAIVHRVRLSCNQLPKLKRECLDCVTCIASASAVSS